MKKIIIFFILVILISPMVQAGIFDFLTGKATDNLKYSNIQEALQGFVDNYNIEGEVYLVKGYYGDEAENVLSDIPEIFNNKVFQIDPSDGQSYPILPRVFYDSSAPAYSQKGYPTPRLMNPSAQNIIVIGGPCANPLTADLLDMTCGEWPYSPGEAIIKLANNGVYSAIIMAGTTRDDTARLAFEIRNYKTSSKLQSGIEVLFGEAITIGGCGNGVCETTETDENCPSDCIDNNIQITFDTNSQVVTQLAENYIIWSEPPVNKIVYNINTKQTKNIGEGQYHSIYGNYIVYLGKEPTTDFIGNPREGEALYLYDIQTDQSKIIAHSSTSIQYDPPSIYGDKIIYQKKDMSYENHQGPFEMYIYDIQTDQTTKLFDTKRIEGIIPHLYNNKIYYIAPEYCRPEYCIQTLVGTNPDNFIAEQAEMGIPSIWVYNINSNQKTLITTLPREGIGYSDIEVYDDYIVWSDRRTGDYEIYYYNINSNQEVRVTNQLSGQSTPNIYNSVITWTDARNDLTSEGVTNTDIYMCDITKNGQYGGCLTDDEKIRITVNAKNQGGAKIYGRRIVWTDSRNFQGFVGTRESCIGEGENRVCSTGTGMGGNLDIYMYEF